MFDGPWVVFFFVFFFHSATFYLKGEKVLEKKPPENHDSTFHLTVVAAGGLPPCLTLACFSQQDMANAFAQKHLRSIILNVSSQSKLCSVICYW